MTLKCLAACFAISLTSSVAHAQPYPSKPIRILVPSIAGSAPDVRVRQIAPKLNEAVGQPVIVDNRPGANGTIATQLAARAQPDGPRCSTGSSTTPSTISSIPTGAAS